MNEDANDDKTGIAEKIARIASTARTKTKAKILIALEDGEMRSTEIIKLFEESPTTIYRALSDFVSADLVEKIEDGDNVKWRLTPLGKKFLNSIRSVVENDVLQDMKKADSPNDFKTYLIYLLPAGLFALSLGQAVYWSKPYWVAGGAILSLFVFIIIRKALK